MVEGYIVPTASTCVPRRVADGSRPAFAPIARRALAATIAGCVLEPHLETLMRCLSNPLTRALTTLALLGTCLAATAGTVRWLNFNES